MIVEAPCEACGETRKFMEFKAEPCGPHADARDRKYGFRCLKCKTLVEEITDVQGRVHAWKDGEHVEA
jgi:hypothetical protein